jgi:hypothetical protein
MEYFVRIMLSGAGYFAEVEIKEGDTISRLAKRACAEFPSWNADPSQLSLHLAAEGGDDLPSSSAVGSARHLDQIGWSLKKAGVYPGAWLVARKISAFVFFFFVFSLCHPHPPPMVFSYML